MFSSLLQQGSDSLLCVFRPPLSKNKPALLHVLHFPFFSCIHVFLSVLLEEAVLCFFAYIFIISASTSCLEVYMYAAAEVGVYLDCCSLPAGCKSTSSPRSHAIFSSSFALRVSHRHRADLSRRQRAGSWEGAVDYIKLVVGWHLVLRRLEEDEEGAVSSRGSPGNHVTALLCVLPTISMNI